MRNTPFDIKSQERFKVRTNASDCRFRLCPEEIFRKELIVFGSFINPFTYCRAVALAAAMGPRYLDADKLGIEFFALRDFEKALDKLRAGQIAKAMFKH
jgi:hypothetical protein